MSGIRVSDHALLRLLERGGAIDIEAFRAGVETSLARAWAAARSMSNSDFLISIDGLTFVVRGETVTTVFESGSPMQKAMSLAKDIEGRG